MGGASPPRDMTNNQTIDFANKVFDWKERHIKL